jgi:hypothetical protein
MRGGGLTHEARPVTDPGEGDVFRALRSIDGVGLQGGGQRGCIHGQRGWID